MDSYNYDTECHKILELGNCLLKSLDSLPSPIKGYNKLKSKIQQEIFCLEKAKQANRLKKEHISSSNLHHYEAFVNCVLNDPNCISILELFHLNNEIVGKKKIYVDIVSDQRTKWIKVIARNPKALSQISKGEGEYQQKSIVDHAEEYLECAKQNAILFKPPVVEFYFASGIEIDLAEELSSIGIFVSGNILGVESENKHKTSELLKIEPHQLNRDINRLNLDVPTMIAYVSALTNGHADRKVRGKVLSQQAESERKLPVKPILDNIFKEKELYACETAVSNFKSIVDILGGEGEKKRTEQLLSRINVVEDVPYTKLKIRGKIKARALAVFGTGQALEALTMTSNSSFVRAAETQGIHLDVFIHEPRALTERKEIPDLWQN
ncbi:UPF0415 protein C7orf25 homolog [Halyomorpha halys]|uniref:UPF0415 protein C7orf25 homolog n=1 Tax=Halyomorpha halys TaxID=286706 RepID=UPI0006D4D428|nr:UPF0415 protein C7orf25 homolog isoform X1 [Halyomorpha halys]